MHAPTLADSLFPAQADRPLIGFTVGDTLRAAAARTPAAAALIESDANGGLARRWTYAEQVAAQRTPTQRREVSEWPMTGSGRIQKFALRDQWVEGKFQ